MEHTVYGCMGINRLCGINKYKQHGINNIKHWAIHLHFSVFPYYMFLFFLSLVYWGWCINKMISVQKEKENEQFKENAVAFHMEATWTHNAVSHPRVKEKAIWSKNRFCVYFSDKYPACIRLFTSFSSLYALPIPTCDMSTTTTNRLWQSLCLYSSQLRLCYLKSIDTHT